MAHRSRCPRSWPAAGAGLPARARLPRQLQARRGCARSLWSSPGASRWRSSRYFVNGIVLSLDGDRSGRRSSRYVASGQRGDAEGAGRRRADAREPHRLPGGCGDPRVRRRHRLRAGREPVLPPRSSPMRASGPGSCAASAPRSCMAARRRCSRWRALRCCERTGRRGLSRTSCRASLLAVVAALGVQPHASSRRMVVDARRPLVLPAADRRGVRAQRAAVGDWLGRGFDADARDAEVDQVGPLSDSPAGRYLAPLQATDSEGPVVADLLCYLRLHTELALRAKGRAPDARERFRRARRRRDPREVRRAALSRRSIGTHRDPGDPADAAQEPQGPVAAAHAGGVSAHAWRRRGLRDAGRRRTNPRRRLNSGVTLQKADCIGLDAADADFRERRAERQPVVGRPAARAFAGVGVAPHQRAGGEPRLPARSTAEPKADADRGRRALLHQGRARSCTRSPRRTTALPSCRRTARHAARALAGAGRPPDVVPALPEFLARNPEVTVDLLMSNTLIDVVEQNIDVDIRIGKLVDSSLVGAQALAQRARACARRRAYLDGTPGDGRTGRSRRAQLPHLPHQRRTHGVALPRRRAERCRRYPCAGSLTTDNGYALLNATLAGVGIALMPDWSVRDHLAAGRLLQAAAGLPREPHRVRQRHLRRLPEEQAHVGEGARVHRLPRRDVQAAPRLVSRRAGRHRPAARCR